LVGGADTAQTSENGTLAEESSDAVTLITLHAAKGLEYPVVFIVGMDEGSLPHARSVDKPEQLEEERRLAYVGFTRAMYRLYLVRARRRAFFGESQYTEPSRFLDDIPLNLVSSPNKISERTPSQNNRSTRRNAWDDDDYNQDVYSSNDSGRVFGGSGGNASSYGSKPKANNTTNTSSKWTPRTGSYSSPSVPPSLPTVKKNASTPSSSEPAKPKEQQYKPGDKVRHILFGEGTILKSEMEKNTEFVEVQFQGKVGKKRLSMDFAKLEKI
ncbi:MAG: ATP-binding domain-containing protein, partial [Chloroflexota bacterium]|nr:ATP-binding domain-containing protein [Chloroflexota bacterium]